MRIALVNCAQLPEPDPDERPLLDALRAAGFGAETISWDGARDDERQDPGAFDLAFLRATWNYHHDLPRFLAWTDRAASLTTLLNPAPVVRWNADKRYLADLESRGVPIVPTVWPDPDETIARQGGAVDRAIAQGWTDVVVKPVVSAGSFLTKRFDLRIDESIADARAFVADALPGRPMMVQRFMPSVETTGERSLVWIAGEVTHAIHKHPRFAGNDERVEAAAVSDDERAFAHRAVDTANAAVGETVVGRASGATPDLFYARVDVMRDDDGTLRLAELELIEPSLYFDLGPAGLERFVAQTRALATRVTRTARS